MKVTKQMREAASRHETAYRWWLKKNKPEDFKRLREYEKRNP